MTIRTRLAQLEKAGRAANQAGAAGPAWRTEEEWLALFEECGRRGAFAGEPDFPAALAAYRGAMRQAAAHTDPPFDPPADFMPSLAGSPERRLLEWRTPERFPAVDAAWEWLAELLSRVAKGIPPAPEAEFSELGRWFDANAARLHQLFPTGALDLGAGRTVSLPDLRYRVARGPRVHGAGELAEQLRRLKAHAEGRDALEPPPPAE